MEKDPPDLSEYGDNSTAFLAGAEHETDQALLDLVPQGPLRDRLHNLMRHERLLDWVSAIASDMTSTHDLDHVIGVIVENLRRVTRSDMAYVSRNSASETFIRYSSGIRTEGYRTIRMPLGTGVLGKAATGRAIVATTDYLADPQIKHIEDIDTRVRNEGVRAILGVPMTLHGEVHGALLIADRRARTYPPDVIDTLATVALHTSAVIANAKRIADVSAANARLYESHERAFLDALLEGSEPDIHDANDVGYSFSAGKPSVLLNVDTCAPFARVRDDIREVLGTIPRQGNAVVVFHESHLCVLTRAARERELVETLMASGKRSGMGMRIGISNPFAHPEQAKAAHRQAEQALSTLALLDVSDRFLHGGQLGAVGFLIDAMKASPDTPSPLGPIQVLVDYDKARHSALTRTAWILAEYSFHIPTAARRLHVHENTVRQRIERIHHLLGENWRAPERFLDIHVALRVWAAVYG